MDIYYTFTITYSIILMNYDGVKSQSISLQGSGEAIQGEEFTLECNITSQQTVYWYQGTNRIAWSNNYYTGYNNNGCRIYSLINRNNYMFKECGVKHKLTIKYIDYNRDNGTVWRCVINVNGNYISSNRVTVSVTYPVVLSHQRSIAMEGSSFILICESNISNVKWYRGNQELSIYYTGRSPDGCQHGNTYLYQLKRCGIQHDLTITSVDYKRDNGAIFQCRAGSYQSNTFTLYVNVLPRFTISSTPVHGQSFDLICRSTSTVLWYRTSSGERAGSYIGTSYVDSNSCSIQPDYNSDYKFKSCGSVNQTLTITSVDFNRDNGKVWTCFIKTATQFSDSYSMFVTVLPRFIISTTPVHGKSFDLICRSTYSVSWYRQASGEDTGSYIGTSYVDSNSCSIQPGYNSDYKFKSCGSVNQTLTITSVDFNRDNGKVWTCFIKTATQFSDSYSMVVTVPVSSVDITSTDLNLSTITVEENQQISIQCVTSFASPEPVVDLHVCNNSLDGRCNIYRTTKYSENKTSIIFQVTLNSTLEIDDTRLYCTANNTDTKIINSTSITLYILHRPSVRIEEGEGKLLCIADGRPENMTFLPWKHSIDNKLVREIEGYYINTTVYSLNITNNQNNDGNYTCTVNNGISKHNTKQLNQIAYYNVNLKVQPTFYYNEENNNNLLVGQNGSFSLKYLKDTTVSVSWYTNDTNLQTSKRITIREEPTEISHPYNNNIKLSGIKTILTITSIVITDQGNYTCQVCNQYGCSSKTFEMDVLSTTKQARDDDGIPAPDVGKIIIGTSVGATVMLICIVVIIFIVVFKRRTRKPDDQSGGKCKGVQGNHKNPGPPQPIIIENDLYVSSDVVMGQPHVHDKVPVEMEIIENDLYISSDTLDDKKEPPVYTQVKKASQNVKTADNNVPSNRTESSQEYVVDQKKKAEDRTKNNPNDVVYYNTTSDVISYNATETDDPYINAEYVNRKQLEKINE